MSHVMIIITILLLNKLDVLKRLKDAMKLYV